MNRTMKRVIYTTLGVAIMAALGLCIFRTPDDITLDISPDEVFRVEAESGLFDMELEPMKKSEDAERIAELCNMLSGEYSFSGYYRKPKDTDGGGFSGITFYGKDGEIIEEVDLLNSGHIVSGKHFVLGYNMFAKKDGLSRDELRTLMTGY